MHEIAIRGADVLDGTGGAVMRADVAIAHGRIAAVGRDVGTARRVIDAPGLVLTPGFIDVHTHSDYSLPANPRAESKIRQGVTTEVLGNCGYSVAPVPPGMVELLRDYLAASGPWYPYRETSFTRYVDEFPATAVNTVLQVGHNTLRLVTVGMERRAARPDELQRMARLLEEALEAGALGLSSGLFTPPGAFAGPDEMHALGAVLHRHGAGYASHIRDEARAVLAAADEAITLGEACGVHVQIGHLKVSGTENWGTAGKLLDLVDRARGRGVRVDCDQYPYTTATNPLRNLLPAWVQEGGTDAMIARLTDRAVRARIADDVAASGCGAFGRLPSWDAVRVALSAGSPAYAGRTVAAIAAELGVHAIDAVCRIIVGDRGGTRVILESMSEADVLTIMRAPWVLVGSDGVALAPYGPTAGGKPHPRYYGTFARLLGRYVREQGALTLPEAIRKMTGASAAALGLRERGLVRAGYAADLTLFDPGTVTDRATYDEPDQYPAGIRTVIVNGTVVVDEGEHTGTLPGRVLRRGTRGVE